MLTFSAELYVNKFMKISWLPEMGLTVFLILKVDVLNKRAFVNIVYVAY